MSESSYDTFQSYFRSLFGSLDNGEVIYLAPADNPARSTAIGTLQAAVEFTTAHRDHGVFSTTGLFSEGAARQREYLACTPALILDADIKAKLIAEGMDDDLAEQEIRGCSDTTLQQLCQEHSQLIIDTLVAVGLAPSSLIFTGGGHHVYVQVDFLDQRKTERIIAVQKALVRKLNAMVGFELFDRQVTDPGTRYARVPGTANTKCKPVRYASVVQNGGPTFTLEQLEEAIGDPPAEAESSAHHPTGSTDTSSVSDIFSRYWKRGQRHDLALALCGYLAKADWTWKHVEGVLIEIATQTEDEELPGRLKDLQTTFHRLDEGKDVAGFIALSHILTAHDMERLERVVGIPRITIEDDRGTDPWPEPGELPSTLSPVTALPVSLLPERLKPWLVDIAERLQCPLEYPVVGALIALATIIGRKVGIRPKRADDWLVVPNLWGLIIGRPGLLKTPALREVMRPLSQIEQAALEDYKTNLKKFITQDVLTKAKRTDLERRLKAAVRKEDSTDGILEAFTLLVDDATEPTATRYIVNDATVEKLHEILQANPNGVLLLRDELAGWLRSLDREGHEADRAFYLEAWNGDGSFTYDRIGRGTIRVEACVLSLFGTIQPGPLNAYLLGALRGGRGDDGLMQRFQLLVYPDDPGPWQNVDRWPDVKAREQALELYKKLATLDPFTLSGAKTDANGSIPFFRFAPDAQGLFDDWRADLEAKLRRPDEHPAIEAHLSKYRSLMPSLALLFHLTDIVGSNASGPVSLTAAQLAAAWCDFLEVHARRVYHGVTHHSLIVARLLGRRIRAGKVPNPFTPRQIYNCGWSGLSTPEDVDQAAAVLEDADWLRSERVVTGRRGRPRFQYHINPKLTQEKRP